MSLATKFAGLIAAAVPLAAFGCTEACGCINNSPKLKAWARCATDTALPRLGQYDFVTGYVSDYVHDRPHSDLDQRKFQSVVADIDQICGEFDAAYREDFNDYRGSGKVDGGKIYLGRETVSNSPEEVLMTRGMRRAPPPVASSSGIQD